MDSRFHLQKAVIDENIKTLTYKLTIKISNNHIVNHGFHGLQHLVLHLAHFEIEAFDFWQDPFGLGVVIALALSMASQLPTANKKPRQWQGPETKKDARRQLWYC
ncbi:hypothetical protein V4V47_002380 [Vibrio mimicus]|nr:hypothetical protein [Vibrio mimicus]